MGRIQTAREEFLGRKNAQTWMKPMDYAPHVHGGIGIKGHVHAIRITHTEVIQARVNHGRWVVDCPECPSAQMGDPADPRFLCAECAAGWCKVVYPSAEFIEQLEELFRIVPQQRNMNWVPGETLDELAQSIQDGLKLPKDHKLPRWNRPVTATEPPQFLSKPRHLPVPSLPPLYG